jgi:multidrug transporter EmrE-like cation transporter
MIASAPGPIVTRVTAVAYVAASALFTTGGVLLLRKALAGVDLSPSAIRSVVVEPVFVIGFVLYVLSFLTWLLALRRYEATVIFPAFVGAQFAGVVLGGYLFLGESVTAPRLVGIAVILGGIALVAR